MAGANRDTDWCKSCASNTDDVLLTYRPAPTTPPGAMAKDFTEALWDADSEEEVEELMGTYERYFRVSCIMSFMAGYLDRPIRDMQEVREFIKFMADKEGESDEVIIKRAEDLQLLTAGEFDRFAGEDSIEQQERWLSRASEYYDT